jgi:hypothetical protein
VPDRLLGMLSRDSLALLIVAAATSISSSPPI